MTNNNFDKLFSRVASKGSFITMEELSEFEFNLAKYHGTRYSIGVANATTFDLSELDDQPVTQRHELGASSIGNNQEISSTEKDANDTVGFTSDDEANGLESPDVGQEDNKSAIENILKETIEIEDGLASDDSEIGEKIEGDIDSKNRELDAINIAGAPAIGATETFIPPEPAVSDEPNNSESSDAINSEEANNKIDKAAVVNEEVASASNRPSLFELVTRTGKAAMGFSDHSADSGNDKKQTKAVDAPKLDPVINKVVESKAGLDDQQKIEQGAEVDNVEPHGQISQSQALQDDLLDIPAFLRRQAN